MDNCVACGKTSFENGLSQDWKAAKSVSSTELESKTYRNSPYSHTSTKVTKILTSYTDLQDLHTELCSECIQKERDRRNRNLQKWIIGTVSILLLVIIILTIVTHSFAGAVFVSMFPALIIGVNLYNHNKDLRVSKRRGFEFSLFYKYTVARASKLGCDMLWTVESFEKKQQQSQAKNLIMEGFTGSQTGALSGKCQNCGASITGTSYNTESNHDDLQLRAYRCKKCGSMYCYACREKIGFSIWSGFKSPCPKCGAVLKGDNLGYIYNHK